MQFKYILYLLFLTLFAFEHHSKNINIKNKPEDKKTVVQKDKIKVSSDIGLLIETLLISPIAIALFIYLINLNLNVFSYKEPLLSFYLFWSGFMTLVPLFLYTLGFKIIGIGPASMILFLTPTSQFLLGITYFDETLTLEKFFGFVIIWIAVSIYLNELRKE